eukprot:11222996-Lingulodinium_polyedra.AAC.1
MRQPSTERAVARSFTTLAPTDKNEFFFNFDGALSLALSLSLSLSSRLASPRLVSSRLFSSRLASSPLVSSRLA